MLSSKNLLIIDQLFNNTLPGENIFIWLYESWDLLDIFLKKELPKFTLSYYTLLLNTS